ncbi:hypothetical protein HMPREF9946_03687 [Acetobacteraceae bacterium AT-5844]|nr:hypothetical protein HMPREF9946_03687 [Acetobacteraceae bacterium AT-5844]
MRFTGRPAADQRGIRAECCSPRLIIPAPPADSAASRAYLARDMAGLPASGRAAPQERET